MAEHQLTCKTCGAQFQSAQPRAVSCSDECRAERKRRRAKPKAPITSITYECWWCGKQYHPRRREASKACSRECGFKVKDFIRSARITGLMVSHSVYRFKCADCYTWANGRSNGRRCSACIERNRPNYQPVKGTIRQCELCNSDFIAMSGAEFSSTKFCSKTCRNAHRRKQPWYKPMQAAAKAKRRAARRGARVKEAVKPQVVFDRDAWRCQACGCKTPKGLRGTCDPKAPELDHIVPISKGGEHSYRNTQCLCRSCNAAKSDGLGGQLLLFG